MADDTILGNGAEAIVTKAGDEVTKTRPKKAYRHPDLDLMLRKRRTRKEAKVLAQLEDWQVTGPGLIRADENEGVITMTYMEGDKLRDVLERDVNLASQVGLLVARLHDHDLIHGDLTTSNMILAPGNEAALIDFGLAYTSTRIEDKAVDLHLFKQALESKHHRIAAEAWQAFLNSYHPQKRTQILERLEAVEKRGRNKA
ncbi:MAG: KEOPS complex kinase/ATPase Bud32 [Candidatus Woesearchaeota archaeon]